VGGGLDEVWSRLEDGSSLVATGAVFGAAVAFLGFVFLLSAVPKLRRPELAALAIVDFGIGRRAHYAAGLALGLAELVLAALLLVSALATSSVVRTVPAMCAAAVLWVFALFIGRAVRSAEEFSCFCFGNEESTISVRTLLRTVALAVMATIVAVVAFDQAAADLDVWIFEAIVAAAVLGTGLVARTAPPVWQVSK
jgi:hypothetical protein